MAVHTVTAGNQSKGVALGEEETQGTAVEATNLFEIASETFNEEIEEIQVDGLSGARSQAVTNHVQGKKDPKGNFVLRGARYAELLYLLEFGLGAYGSGSAWLAANLPSLTVFVDKVVKTLRFKGSLVNELTLESSAGEQALQATFDLIAMSMDDDQSFPTGLSYATGVPLVHRALTLQVGAESTYCEMVRWHIGNNLYPDGYRNSQSRVALMPQGNREVDGALNIDWNDTYSTRVWDLWKAGSHAAIQADYTDGTNTLSIRAPQVKFNAGYPDFGDREAKLQEIPFKALASTPGAQDEVQIIFS